MLRWLVCFGFLNQESLDRGVKGKRMSVYGCLLLLQSYHRRLCYPNRSLSQSVEVTYSDEENFF